MAEELENQTGGAGAGEPVIPSLHEVSVETAVEQPDHVDSAESLAIQHEGNRGGRGRIDGLVPGSEAAKRADGLYGAIRKWQDRNPGKVHPQERSIAPAMAARLAARRKPLPSAPLNPLYSSRPEPPPVIPSFKAPPVPGSDAPFGSPLVPNTGDPADLFDSARAALVAWAGTDIEPLLKDLIKLLEEWREYAREKRLRLARLPDDLIAEINKETAWEETPKKIICESGSRVLAKLLNKGGISAEYKDEIFLGLAVVMIAGSEIRSSRRIANLVRAANPQIQKTT